MRLTPLAEVCDIEMGQAPVGSSYNQHGEGYPLLAGAGDFGIDFPIATKYTTEPTKISQPGDVLLCVRATVGDLNWSDKAYCLGRGVAGLRPRNGKLDRQYLWRCMEYVRPELEKQGRGSTFLQVSRRDIAGLTIPLPANLGEQRRIAAILDKADAIRRKREQALALTDEFLRSVFLDMFGDPASNSNGWPISTIDDLGDVQGGLQVSSKRAGDLTMPYLRVANVYRDRLALSEIKEINLTDGEFRRTRLEKGDILIVEGHGNPEEIGRAAIWDGSINPCVHQNHLIRFRANRKRALPEYIARLLNSDGGRQQLIGAGRTTSGLNTISTRKVKEVTVPLPPLALQQRFAQIIEKQIALSTKIAGQLSLSDAIFGSLSQRAFRGEL